MQFLKILLWMVVAVMLTVLANHNWHDVTINLWGDIQVDIKLPVLLAIFFLVGFLPPYLLLHLLLRARRWQQRRREEALERQRVIDSAHAEHTADLEPQI